MAVYDTASALLGGKYWEILAKESQEAYEQFGAKTRVRKTKKGLREDVLNCVEARELIFLLGNDLIKYRTPDEIIKVACDTVSKKINRPVTGALHFNKSLTSLHAHIIYSERELLDEPMMKVAERNLFFDANGKRRYKKSEILDENKNLLPGCKIISKGEVYESHCFGSIKKEMLNQKWLQDIKDEIMNLRNGDLKTDIEITQYDPKTGKLPQQYIGNRVPKWKAERIAKCNEMVKSYNQYVEDGWLSQDDAAMILAAYSSSMDKYRVVEWYLNQIRQQLEGEKEIRKLEINRMVMKAKLRTGPYWQRYAEIRDATWEVFIKAQRKEFEEIRKYRELQRELYIKNSYVVKDNESGEEVRKLYSRKKLEANNYFETLEDLRNEQRKHEKTLAVQRKYQEIAKGRQQIVRSLLRAGASEDVIKKAMANYEEAMKLLQNYGTNPNEDFELRRLKVAQWSLAKAKVEAEKHIEKLSEEQTKAEESKLETVAEEEYQAFKKGEEIQENTDQIIVEKEKTSKQIETSLSL